MGKPDFIDLYLEEIKDKSTVADEKDYVTGSAQRPLYPV